MKNPMDRPESGQTHQIWNEKQIRFDIVNDEQQPFSLAN